ncbi:hypothetical protein OW865_26080 [Klebsiella pneumoniae]
MTTDITELAQSLKAEANTTADAIDRLKAFPGDELIDLSQHEGEQVDIDIATLNQWYDLSSPANILVLVEALEKAQAKIIELQRKYEIDPRTHEIIDLEERVAELESEVEKWKQEAEVWEQVAEKQLAMAIELESRTVKLVDCDFGAVQNMSGGSTDYCHGFVDGTQNAIRAIAAAGIKVKAE